jgi:hypothetical protein
MFSLLGMNARTRQKQFRRYQDSKAWVRLQLRNSGWVETASVSGPSPRWGSAFSDSESDAPPASVKIEAWARSTGNTKFISAVLDTSEASDNDRCVFLLLFVCVS